jgi:hypothetical protein
MRVSKGVSKNEDSGKSRASVNDLCSAGIDSARTLGGIASFLPFSGHSFYAPWKGIRGGLSAMSTPRHDCKTDDRKLAIDRPCSACSDGDSEMEYHDHCPPFREGVAAPLEPSPKQFLDTWHMHQAGIVRTAGEYLLAAMEAYAAAVSKNLTDLLNSSDAVHTVTAKKLIAAESRILEFEKEIAALREKL